jgi:F0F1-type ATP synthase membrane subunit c/vacuolar-type H+-ATPase subunit K
MSIELQPKDSEKSAQGAKSTVEETRSHSALLLWGGLAVSLGGVAGVLLMGGIPGAIVGAAAVPPLLQLVWPGPTEKPESETASQPK